MSHIPPLPATTSWTNHASYSVSAYVPASDWLGFQERWAGCRAGSSAYRAYRTAGCRLEDPFQEGSVDGGSWQAEHSSIT